MMPRSPFWAASSPLRMCSSTMKHRMGAAVQWGSFLFLDTVAHYNRSRNGFQLLYSSSASPPAPQQPGDDAIQPPWQGTLRRGWSDLPSRQRPLVPSDLAKRDFEARRLEASLEKTINMLADRFGLARAPKFRARVKAVKEKDAWLAGQATIKEVEDAELEDDLRELDHDRMFAKELAYRSLQEAKQASEAATLARVSSRAGQDCTAEEVRSLLRMETKAAGIAAATEDYATWKQEAWELAKHAWKINTERRRLVCKPVTFQGSEQVFLAYTVASICQICANGHPSSNCPYLRSWLKEDFSLNPASDTLFARKLKFETDFRAVLSYVLPCTLPLLSHCLCRSF